MRSIEPQPGNPWPHDMSISIDNDSQRLCYLLFVRQAWKLPIDELPELEPLLSVGESARPSSLDVNDAVARWRSEWARAWSVLEPDRTVREPDEEIARLLELTDEQLVDAVSAMPSSFWEEGIDHQAFEEWRRGQRDDLTLPFEKHPERVCLDALVPAWRGGLLKIVQLPFAGYFAERVSSATLVVSRVTRFDPALYRRALGTAAPGQMTRP